MKLLVICVQILALIFSVCSFPGGAPLKHCGDMLPGHHAMPIDTESPFSLSASLDDDRVKVTIVSKEDYHFKGFLLEARTNLNEEEAIGVWETRVSNTKTIDCFDSEDSAVTHHIDDDDHDSNEHHGKHHEHDDDHEDKHEQEWDDQFTHHKHFRNVTFTWWPPVDFEQKNINFVATIVKKYSQIYMNVTVPFNWISSEVETSIEEDEAPKNQTETSQKSGNRTIVNDDAEKLVEESDEYVKGVKIAMNATMPTNDFENTTYSSSINNSTLTNTIENTTESTTEKTNFATTVKLIKDQTLKLEGRITEFVHGGIKKFNFDFVNTSPIHRMKKYYAWLKKSIETIP